MAVLCVATTARDPVDALDPERIAECSGELQALLTPILETYGARLVQGAGTGFHLWFGWPIGREDVLPCAARAATALSVSIGEIALLCAPRLGLACGEMLVSSQCPNSGVGEVVGGVPDLAQELAMRARPGQILVSDAARRILGSCFDVMAEADLGPKVFSLGNERPLATRLLARTGPVLGPMIGRARERDLLLGLWESAASGNGQVVLIRGEPGIGKSCLLESVARETMGSSEPPALLQASRFFKDTALYPVTEFIRAAAELNPQRSDMEQQERLRGWLQAQGLTKAEQVLLIAHALGLERGEQLGTLLRTPTRIREGVLQAFCELALNCAAQGCFLFGIEDTHWADPTTLEFLQRLASMVVDAPILLVVTARPEFDPSLLPDDALTVLSLAKLTPKDTGRMIRQVAGDRDLPAQLTDRICGRTDGVPLFVEEITRSVLECGEDRIPEEMARVPETLRDILAIRFDRLGDAKLVAQRAACIGRRFDEDLLATACRDIDIELTEALQGLARAGLVLRRRHGDEGRFAFRHALLREAAYESLPRDRRQEVHQRIYERLRDRLERAADIAAEPEQAAWQAEGAGLPLEAVRQLKTAATNAAQQLASKEALSHLNRALKLLDGLDDDDGHSLLRLELLALLARCRGFADGYGHARSIETLHQARRLAETIHGSTHAIPVLIQAYSAHYTRGEFDEVRRVGQEIGALREWDPQYGPQAVFAARFVAAADLADGAFVAAIDGFERALAILDAAADSAAFDAVAVDHRAPARLLCARACLIKGDQSEADRLLAANDADVRVHTTPQSLILTLVLSALHHTIACDFRRAQAFAQDAKAEAERHDLRMWVSYADLYEALGVCHTEPSRAHFAEYDAARERLRASNTLASAPLCDARFAAALLAAGEIDRAGTIIDQSLSVIEQGREAWSHAELHRVKAISVWASGGDRRLAAWHLDQARQVASAQGAGLWQRYVQETEEPLLPDQATGSGLRRAVGDQISR